MFALVAARQLQIIQRRLLRFLDEAMQQNHPPFRIDVEQYPGDAALGQMRPYFANAATEGSAYWHPDRPSKFDCLDILTDELAILGLQAFQPFPERFSARFRAEENRRDSPIGASDAGCAGSAAGIVFRFAATYEVYRIRYTRPW